MQQQVNRERGRLPLFIASGILSLPFVYVLSYGPALQLATRYDTNLRIFKQVYMPLRWLMRHFPPLNDLMNWYTNLFG